MVTVWTDLKCYSGRLKFILSILSTFHLKFLPDHLLGAIKSSVKFHTLVVGRERDEGMRPARQKQAESERVPDWDWPSPSLPTSPNTKLPPWEYIYLQESITFLDILSRTEYICNCNNIIRKRKYIVSQSVYLKWSEKTKFFFKLRRSRAEIVLFNFMSLGSFDSIFDVQLQMDFQ